MTTATRISGSSNRSSALAARPRKSPDLSTYAGRVAARLNKLRIDRGWSMEQMQTAIKHAGGPKVPTSTLYAYELGTARGGVDVPLSLLPFYAGAFGYSTAHGWLPTE